MSAARSLLLMIAALLTLLAAPAALAAAAQPQASVAAAEPCSMPCDEMPGDCGEGSMRCNGAMSNCRASAGCGMAVAVEPAGSAACGHGSVGIADVRPGSTALHGRSIKPEIHPPSVLDQQA